MHGGTLYTDAWKRKIKMNELCEEVIALPGLTWYVGNALDTLADF
jgi:hypothetical protein